MERLAVVDTKQHRFQSFWLMSRAHRESPARDAISFFNFVTRQLLASTSRTCFIAFSLTLISSSRGPRCAFAQPPKICQRSWLVSTYRREISFPSSSITDDSSKRLLLGSALVLRLIVRRPTPAKRNKHFSRNKTVKLALEGSARIWRTIPSREAREKLNHKFSLFCSLKAHKIALCAPKPICQRIEVVDGRSRRNLHRLGAANETREDNWPDGRFVVVSFFSALTDLANPDNKIAPRVITLSASYHETQPRPFSAAGRWEVFGNCAINQPATFRASEASKWCAWHQLVGSIETLPILKVFSHWIDMEKFSRLRLLRETIPMLRSIISG